MTEEQTIFFFPGTGACQIFVICRGRGLGSRHGKIPTNIFVAQTLHLTIPPTFFVALFRLDLSFHNSDNIFCCINLNITLALTFTLTLNLTLTLTFTLTPTLTLTLTLT